MTAQGLAARVAALEDALRDIQATRLAGLGLVNPRLAVRGVGFEGLPGHVGLAWGVMLTPWFMNLQLLPLDDAGAAVLPASGGWCTFDIAGRYLDFIGDDGSVVGPAAACPLFSPMHRFADQAAAVATATEVLRQLRPPVLEKPARRGFLLARPAARGAA
jgi:[NiFe] hydrogenase assembly HybE family chaperone